jgi:uncharacterized protein with HEPN domain
MSKKHPKLLLVDIINSTNKIVEYTNGLTFEQFINDSKTIDAVIRNFEIIGEAANRLSEEFKEMYPNVEWHRIRGFRNRIVHDYMGIDYETVWLIKENYLPLLKQHVSEILNKT